MLVLPSDHHIGRIPEFHDVLHLAYQGALDHKMMTLGMHPTRPETGYGYIHTLKKGEVNQERVPVEAFVEKPPLDVAQAYLEDGRYVWNSGMFMFKAHVLLDAVQIHLPDLYTGLMDLKGFLDQNDQEGYHACLAQCFPTFPSVSLDVGIMEKVDCVEVIFSDLGWNDVGHWAALADFMPSDDQGNIQCGDALVEHIQSHHNIVATELPVVLIGIDQCVVVQTEDALLICARDQVQNVKLGVHALKNKGRTDLI
jgi:mannose-1-phosphate guanylyltransferase